MILFAELDSALKGSSKSYIQLTNDIIATTLTGTGVLIISRSLTLDGNGFEIKSTENVIQNSRILNVCNLISDNVTIKNIKLNMLAAKGGDTKVCQNKIILVFLKVLFSRTLQVH